MEQLPIKSGNSTGLPAPSQGKNVLIAHRGQGVDLYFDENGIRKRMNYATLEELDGKVVGITGEVAVRDTFGSSQTDAVSQKFFTETINGMWDQTNW